MAKILDQYKLTGSIQKVVELPHGFIINGSYYDKTTMVVKPFKCFPALGDARDLAMNKRLILKGAYTSNDIKTHDTILVDRYDPTITYVFTTSIRDNTLTMMKFKETENSIDLLANVNFGAYPTTNPNISCILGQDAYYIYIGVETNTTTPSNFVRIDKSTYAITNNNPIGSYGCGITLFKETDQYIFWGCKRYFGNNQVWRFNKTTQTHEVITCLPRAGTTYFSANYSEPWVVSDSENYVYSVFQAATPNRLCVQRYNFDFTKMALTDYITEAEAVITWDGVATQLPNFTGSAYLRTELFVSTDSKNRKYLNIFMYENPGSTTSAQMPNHGIYTFLIDPTTKDLTYKGFFRPSTTYMRGFLSIKNNTFVIAATDDATFFIAFDEGTETWATTETLSNQPQHIGVDLDENIWVVNTLTEVDMYAPFVPTSVKIAYEKTAYKYEGINIDTYITIEAKNYAGSNIAVNLELTITNGDAVFTSNSAKIITETTGTTGPKTIPITIKSAANLTITPKLIL